MPTNNLWLDKHGSQAVMMMSQFNKKVKLVPVSTQGNSINDLVNYLIAPASHGGNWALDDLFTDPLDWLQNVSYYPFNVNVGSPNNGVLKTLRIGTAVTDVKAEDINLGVNSYYTLGEIYIPHKYNNFADYNGYTEIKAYLPFYGYVDLPTNEVMGKYVQFRLYVDYSTGQAQHIIAVSSASIEQPLSPIASDGDAIERILSTHIVQLGVEIPISATNSQQVIRNIIMGSVKTAGSIAIGYFAGQVAPTTTGTVKHISTERNPTTGRQITTGTDTDIRTHHLGQMSTAQAVNEVFDTSTNALAMFTAHVQSDRANNTFVSNFSPRSVHIVIYRPKILPKSEGYNHLYGEPLGEIKTLNEISGYTEVSRIHFEGQYFGTATATEYAMIEQAFSDGVILP